MALFVAAIAPVKGAGAAVYVPADDGIDADLTRSVRVAGKGYYSVILRHCTGPAATAVFLKPASVKVTATASVNVVKEMMVNSQVVRHP